MAIDKRIRRIRKMRGWTQMEAARNAGFNGKNADVRITQYESGARTPQKTMTEVLARGFGVESSAIDVPNVDNYFGVLQTLFYLEDEYGLEIVDSDKTPQLKFHGKSAGRLKDDLVAWYKEFNKLKNGEISKQEYDEWRYTHPKIPAERSKKRRDELRKLKFKEPDREI